MILIATRYSGHTKPLKGPNDPANLGSTVGATVSYAKCACSLGYINSYDSTLTPVELPPCKKSAAAGGQSMANSLLWQKRGDDHDYPTLYLSTQRLTIALRKYILYPMQIGCVSVLLKMLAHASTQGTSPFQLHTGRLLPPMDHTSFATATPVQDNSRPSSLSFVCEPPKSVSPSIDEACALSQISPSLSASYASGDIQISSPMCSDLRVPGMPNAIYMKLIIDKNRDGVPKVFASKTLLRCDGQISAPSITAGTRLETGSLHPVDHGMHRKIVQCIYAEHGRAILEVATYYDGEGGKMRVWELSSFLVSLPAILVDMPVADVSTPWAFWGFFPSCLRCL